MPQRDFGSRDLQLTGSVDRVAPDRRLLPLLRSSSCDVEASRQRDRTMLGVPTGKCNPSFTKPALPANPPSAGTARPASWLQRGGSMNDTRLPDFDTMTLADFE